MFSWCPTIFFMRMIHYFLKPSVLAFTLIVKITWDWLLSTYSFVLMKMADDLLTRSFFFNLLRKVYGDW